MNESKSWLSQIYARVNCNMDQPFLHRLVETLIIPISSFNYVDFFVCLHYAIRQFEQDAVQINSAESSLTQWQTSLNLAANYTLTRFTEFSRLHLVKLFINFSGNSNITWVGGCLNKRFFISKYINTSMSYEWIK